MARTIGRIRTQGFAFMRSNQFSGLEAISYPVPDLRGRMIAALTVPYVKRLDEPGRMSAAGAQAVLAETVAGPNAALGSSAPRPLGGRSPRRPFAMATVPVHAVWPGTRHLLPKVRVIAGELVHRAAAGALD